MGLFPYYVEHFDVSSRRHHVGDFRRLKAAQAAARHALESPRVVLAVVKTTSGMMVYAVDGQKEWTEEPDESAGDALRSAKRGFRDVEAGGAVVPMA